jgi:hypothetical protein
MTGSDTEIAFLESLWPPFFVANLTAICGRICQSLLSARLRPPSTSSPTRRRPQINLPQSPQIDTAFRSDTRVRVPVFIFLYLQEHLLTYALKRAFSRQNSPFAKICQDFTLAAQTPQIPHLSARSDRAGTCAWPSANARSPSRWAPWNAGSSSADRCTVC